MRFGTLWSPMPTLIGLTSLSSAAGTRAGGRGTDRRAPGQASSSRVRRSADRAPARARRARPDGDRGADHPACACRARRPARRDRRDAAAGEDRAPDRLERGGAGRRPGRGRPRAGGRAATGRAQRRNSRHMIARAATAPSGSGVGSLKWSR